MARRPQSGGTDAAKRDEQIRTAGAAMIAIAMTFITRGAYRSGTSMARQAPSIGTA